MPTWSACDDHAASALGHMLFQQLVEINIALPCINSASDGVPFQGKGSYRAYVKKLC